METKKIPRTYIYTHSNESNTNSMFHTWNLVSKRGTHFFLHTIHCRTTQIECTQWNVCAILGHISSSCFFPTRTFSSSLCLPKSVFQRKTTAFLSNRCFRYPFHFGDSTFCPHLSVEPFMLRLISTSIDAHHMIVRICIDDTFFVCRFHSHT